MISLDRIQKYFYKGKQNQIHVLDDIHLDLPEKGMVAIFGRSGCGKTTLLNVMGGLDNVEHGSIEVNGEDMKKHRDAVRNRYIGYVFQNYNLNKEETVFDNVADALRLCGIRDNEEIRQRVNGVLRCVDMERFAGRLPDNLSGGQQQRVAIARALVKKPQIILADEPTGNLDEGNTLKVMDLLKRIAQDCLVVLVTHEADLVDYYCDQVVELSDGKVVNIRENAATAGLTSRNKNDIFLGELAKEDMAGDFAQIDYYGEKPQEPVRLRIVQYHGKTYLQVNTPRIQILDESSEIHLREGVFQTHEEKERLEDDLSDKLALIPPVEGKNYGRLFSWWGSVKSGYTSLFQKNTKRGKKLLRRSMALVGAILVFFTALFGVAFQKMSQTDKSYNHNTFYVYTPGEDVSNRLQEALSDPASGIDSLTLVRSYPEGDETIYLEEGDFETFSPQVYATSGYSTNAVILKNSLAESLPLEAGKNTLLEPGEVILSTTSADGFLYKSPLGYISDYEDLIGMEIYFSGSYNRFGEMPTYRIAGIVKSREPAVYMTPMGIANYTVPSVYSNWVVFPLSASDAPIREGETRLVINYKYNSDGTELPSVGQTIRISGLPFVVSEIIDLSDSDDNYAYDAWNYYVCEADYARLATVRGETDKSVYGPYYYLEEEYAYNCIYTVVHSSNPEATKAFLNEAFSTLKVPFESDYGAQYNAILTPDMIRSDIYDQFSGSIISNLISMAVFLGVMSLCVFFIMRSSLMGRVREIGVYRAIGVSRKNLLFRFGVESSVLFTLTVFVGFAISSGILLWWSASSRLMGSLFYYPVWLAVLLLAFLLVVCIFFGVLPVLFLLRKTPSEILRKYDI